MASTASAQKVTRERHAANKYVSLYDVVACQIYTVVCVIGTVSSCVVSPIIFFSFLCFCCLHGFRFSGREEEQGAPHEPLASVDQTCVSLYVCYSTFILKQLCSVEGTMDGRDVQC